MASSSPRVLVLGMIESLTWAVTRCLSRAHIKPTVVGWHRVSPLALTRDCDYVPVPGIRWIDGELHPSLIDAVDKACKRHHADVVVPADYDSTLLLARSGDRLSSARPCAIPDADNLRRLNDKWKFCALLDEVGLPYPQSELVHDAQALRNTSLAFPIITKPVDRWASVGFQIHHSREELERTLSEGKLAAPLPLLAQRYIPGKDVGFGFLARHGRVVAYTAFEQLRRGCRRQFDDKRLRDYVARLVEATGYHGVGEVDTRYDPEADEYQLLELNPRFWASLLYCLKGGINFPELLVQLDQIGDGPGCTTHGDEVRLSAYELAIKQSAQLSERMHDLGSRWMRN
jgi:predicted ATP-grasp superfamily ATP-dependent carboligase